MKSFIITILFVIYASSITRAASYEQWRKDMPCGKRLPTEFREMSIEGCVGAYCSHLPTGAHLCVCNISEETGETKISLETEGKPKREWTTNISPFVFGASIFRVDSAELDSDGKEELLFSVMMSQSVGMGVEYWSLWAIKDNEVFGKIDVVDYGTMSYLTCSDNDKRALLLGSKWIWGWEPNRDSGLYIAGQWYELGCDSSWVSSDRPGIYHRYLYSLANERGKELGKEHPNPIKWHSKKSTRMIIGPYPSFE